MPLSSRYVRHFGRLFKLADYGFAKTRHMLEALPHLVRIEDDDTIGLSQSCFSFAEVCTDVVDKAELKAEFAQDCTELLLTMPNYSMLLQNFNERYNEHFSRQCRPSDYGFEMLLDLFRAVSETVRVVGDQIQLTEPAALSNVELPEMQNGMPDSFEVIDAEE